MMTELISRLGQFTRETIENLGHASRSFVSIVIHGVG